MVALKQCVFHLQRGGLVLFVLAVAILISGCSSLKKTEKPATKPDFNNTAGNKPGAPHLASHVIILSQI